MSPNPNESAIPIGFTEEKFNALQKKAHYQVLFHSNNALFFVPLPTLATTYSHQVVVINEKTGIPEQVYYNQITQMVVDGKHFVVKARTTNNPIIKAYLDFVGLFTCNKKR